ncbi:camp-regulated phospho protein/endosulfine conserved region-domain-containing protein [Gigaspora rosea]|uniref:mRNA stability protein n=1 Tax=Gigaspora rosea TaxID=44941 RepID=A0A397VTB8_9GLOM|nr:camp-regulated phospho protein/endosulfine conserved region-domain-containing protein [Gigaspora rosea]
MLPARQNKIDLDKLTEEEKKIFRMYGRLPTGKDVLSHKLKERKYFDSGDYALTKAGKTQGPVGVQHPSPDNIPHATAIAATTHNSSPVKESSLVHEAELTDEKTVDSEQPADLNTTSTPSTSIPDTSNPTQAPTSTLTHTPAPAQNTSSNVDNS